MWRSFFFAVGTMLIILGAQCIIVGEFSVSNDSSIAEIGKRIIRTGQNTLAGNEIAVETQPDRFSAEPNFLRGFGGQPGGTASQRNSTYGESRMAGNRFGNDQFFNALPTSSNGNSPFRLPGQRNSTLPTQAVSQPIGLSARPKVIRTEDWMPWSLIAAGTIVVLYTKSWQSQRGGE